ncbi:MAG: GMC family oxidoreductase [Actinomycetota bacterium]|nr:GMC family oxidoreductase N-terminal domain-containing protein [Actinomycetota bacterium]
MPDVVVVGAGSAGAIVATRLAQRGIDVLLLEAGPDAVDDVLTTDLKVPVTEYDWGYRSEGDREIDLPRGKVVGGSSATNAVAAVRPQPADLDALGIPQWTWERCVPSLCRFESDREYGAEPYHGSDGPINVERIDLERAPAVTRSVFEALASAFGEALDQNAPRAHGAGQQASNTRHGVRQSTLVTYLRTARDLPSFSLRANAMVDRLVIENSVAKGVVLTSGERIDADEVIVAAGALASPGILMRSGIGPATHLREHGIAVIAGLPVGENLHDHPAIGLMAAARDPAAIDRRLIARSMARHSFDGVAGEEDIHLFGPFTGYGTRAPIPESCFVVAGMVTKPRARGWVRLRSTDPLDPPRVFLNFLGDPHDVEIFTRMLLLQEELFDQPALKEVTEQLLWRPSSVDRAELERVARAAALTDHHEAGTIPIGPCLDPHLRVHGVERLRVVDASVFPDTPRANTNFPTMMVAERFVELWDEERAS